MDERTYQSLNPALLNRIRDYSIRGRTAVDVSETKIKLERPTVRNNNSFSLGTTIRKHGFKEIGNFRWSKLSNN